MITLYLSEIVYTEVIYLLPSYSTWICSVALTLTYQVKTTYFPTYMYWTFHMNSIYIVRILSMNVKSSGFFLTIDFFIIMGYQNIIIFHVSYQK